MTRSSSMTSARMFPTQAQDPRAPTRPGRPVSSCSGRRFPPEPLTPGEIDSLMGACSSRLTGLRDRALIAVLYRSGLRISEALALLPKDLDPDRGTVRVLRGKGDKARTVGMDAAGFGHVERWLTARGEKGVAAAAPVFCTLGGRPLRTSYVRVLLPRLARRAGVERRVHAHGFRHTHASELRGEGVEIGVISKQLGHASIATTAVYLDHIAPVRVIEAMRGRTWGGQ